MKKIFKLSLVCILSLALFSCSNETTKKDTSFTLVDQMNRNVSFEKPAKRIVSSYYISTSLLIALGLEENLVGIEMKADTRNLYKEAAPQLLNLPAMGNSKMFNVEECAKLEPDLVILPISLKEYEEQLESLDIPVLFINPESEEDFIECVQLIATATGTEKRAGELLDFYEECDSYLEENIDKSTIAKVYFSSSNNIFETAGKNMYQNTLIEKTGAINVSEEIESGKWGTISAEQFIKFNPTHIFIEQGYTFKIEDLYNDVRFQDVDAIMNKAVNVFPSLLETWDTPSPCSSLGAIWMASKLYPLNISEETVMEYAKNFYKEFYDIEVTKEMLGI